MFNLKEFITAAGYLGVSGIIFAETGLMVGFFLPGDSLLFTAGFLASQGFLDIRLLVLLCWTAAVIGNSTGYSLGRKFGPKVFVRPESLFFNPEYIERTRLFYEKHGSKTIVLAQFMPIVRTFAPLMAGVGKMRYTKFFFFNILGATFWAAGITILGYYLGTSVPDADRYIVPIVAVIIIASIAPSAYHILKDPYQRAHILTHLKKLFRKN